MSSTETIAVLGAGGTMGKAMAANLLKAGFTVRVWNRSREKAESLSRDGATVLDTPAEAAAGASVIVTMLSDGDAVSEAMSEVGRGSSSAQVIWLQMSTVGEADTDRCAARAFERSLLFVDAPVSGTKQPAEDGTLIVLASGPDELRDRLSPIFDAVGQRTVWAGDAGAGTRLKLAVNSWLMSVVEGAAETLALAEGLGLDPQLVLDTVADGPLDAPYLQMKGSAMIEGSFDPAFQLRLAAKDTGLMVDAVERHGLDLPLITTIHARLAQAVDAHGDKDLSATYLTSAPDRAST